MRAEPKFTIKTLSKEIVQFAYFNPIATLIFLIFASNGFLHLVPYHYSWFYTQRLSMEWLTAVVGIFNFPTLLLLGLWKAVFQSVELKFLYYLAGIILYMAHLVWGYVVGSFIQWLIDKDGKTRRRLLWGLIFNLCLYLIFIYPIYQVDSSPNVICDESVSYSNRLKLVRFFGGNWTKVYGHAFFLASTDNGNNWNQFSDRPSSLFEHVFFLGEDCKFVHDLQNDFIWMWQVRALLISIDHGESWAFFDLPDRLGLVKSVDIIDLDEGALQLQTESLEIYSTYDWGKNWEKE